MKAERLDKLITLQRPVEITGDGWGTATDWQPYATVWATVKVETGDESPERSSLSYKIWIRHRDGVLSSHRVNYGDVILSIVAVIPTERRDGLQLVCRQYNG